MILNPPIKLREFLLLCFVIIFFTDNVYGLQGFVPVQKIESERIDVAPQGIRFFDRVNHHPSYAMGPLSKLSVDGVNSSSVDAENVITILSIDGGGVFGIPALLLLKKIEEKTGRPIASEFDVLAGTSTGSIIVSGLSVLNKDKTVKFSAKEILEYYTNLSGEVFSNSLWYRVKTLWGLLGPEFPSMRRNYYYDKIFGDVRLSELEDDVLVTVYAMKHRKALSLISSNAKKGLENDFLVKDLIAASTSTPSIFAPSELNNISGTWDDLGLDAAIYINNPVLEAFLFAQQKYKNSKFIIISIGSGDFPRVITSQEELDDTKSWGVLQGVLPTFMFSLYGQEAMVDEEMRYVSKIDPAIIGYYRFNFLVDKGSKSLFDGSPENIKKINSYGERMLDENKENIEAVVKILNILNEPSKSWFF